MKRSFVALTLCAVVAVFSMTAFAQSPMMPPPGGDNPDWVSPGLRGDVPTRRGPETLREPRVIKKGALAPSIDDRIAFTTFLQEKNTGLIRLLLRQCFSQEAFLEFQKRKIVGGGAYYSFARLTHAYGYGSDIALDQGELSVGFAGADYGMMTNIGDTPLEQITLNDVRTQDIAAYLPRQAETEARAEYRRVSSTEGLTFDGFHYRKSLPVQENSTYLLRSISYRRSDVLVAFRLVRVDTDGSVIIAWKLLKQYPTPKLERPTRSE